jgi:hypothetical protein
MKIIPTVMIVSMVLAMTPAPAAPVLCFEPTHFQRVVDGISTDKNPYMCP